MNKKIVVLDTGVDLSCPIIKKTNGIVSGVHIYRNENNDFHIITTNEDVSCIHDEVGHGTAIVSIILSHNLNVDLHVVKIFTADTLLADEGLLIFALEYILQNMQFDILNLSLGLCALENDSRLQKVCDQFYDAKKIIVAAFDNNGSISFPAAFKKVIGVTNGEHIHKIDEYCTVQNEMVNICAKGNRQRVYWTGGRQFLGSGNSYACAHFTGILSTFDSFDKWEELFNMIDKNSSNCYTIDRTLSYLPNPVSTYKKAVIFPFNKEAHSIVSGIDSSYFFGYFTHYIGMLYMTVKTITLFRILYLFYPLMSFFILIIFFIDLSVKSLNGKIVLKYKIDTVEEIRRMNYYEQLFMDNDTLRDMKLNNASHFFQRLFEKSSKDYLDKDLKFGLKIELRTMFLNFSREIILGVILLVAVILVYQGKITAGGFAALSSSAGIITQYFEVFTMNLSSSKEKRYYIQLLKNFLIEDSINEYGDKRIDEITSIEFENVSFSYGAHTVLKNISFKVEQGENIALVGENGAGKSTLIRLITGLERPNEGNIYINKINIEEIDIHTYHEKIALVLQDFGKYYLKIKENIGLSDYKGMDDEDKLKNAATKGKIFDFITSTKRGFLQQLGSEYHDGIEASGGQWQRMSIARGYFKKGDVYIMDEPTSALDALAEASVYQEFMNLSGEALSFLVSHRLGSAISADKILFLKNGELIEYANLYYLQASLYKKKGWIS